MSFVSVFLNEDQFVERSSSGLRNYTLVRWFHDCAGFGAHGFSVGSLLGLAGMVLAKLIVEAKVPTGWAIIITLVFSVCCGALNAAIMQWLKANGYEGEDHSVLVRYYEYLSRSDVWR